MIDLYCWTTPNGHKATIFLGETGLPYNVIPVNIGKGEDRPGRQGRVRRTPIVTQRRSTPC